MQDQYRVIDGQAHRIHNIVVHRFRVDESDDPDLHAASPLMAWQESEQGQWVMAHAIEKPIWHRNNNWASFGTDYAVTAQLRERDYTFWALKWGSN
jgi:hypothetical protein